MKNVAGLSVRNILVLAVLLVLGGCSSIKNRGGYVQLYEGNRLSELDTALVKGHNNYRDGSRANDMIRIVAINSADLPSQFGVAEGADSVELIPGTYLVKVLFVSGYVDVDFYRYETFRIRTKPGCQYDITASFRMPQKDIAFDILPAPRNAATRLDCKLDEEDDLGRPSSVAS